MSKPEDAAPRKKMATEDKVALAVIGILGAIAFLALAFMLRLVLVALSAALGLAMAGIAFTTAFLIAMALSIVVIILFALIAGEGIVGEFSAMVVSFFVMTLFFTISIALIF